MTMFISELPIDIQNELRKETDDKLADTCVTQEYDNDVMLMVNGVDKFGRPFCRMKSYPRTVLNHR